MKVLLAVDGSDHSYEAVRALKYLRRPDELTLLHVVDAPRPAYPMMVPEVAQELYSQLERSMKEDGEQLLTRIHSLLPPHSGPVTKQLALGSPAEMIVATAESRHVDLILMGARGLTCEGTTVGKRLPSCTEPRSLRQTDPTGLAPRLETGLAPAGRTIGRRGGAAIPPEATLP